MGWKMLNNEHCILYHQGDSIALIGVENDGEPPFSQFADLSKAMQGTEGMFRILLSHNPTQRRREVLPDSGYRVNPFRTYARHADGNIRTLVIFSHLP